MSFVMIETSFQPSVIIVAFAAGFPHSPEMRIIYLMTAITFMGSLSKFLSRTVAIGA